MIKKIKIGPYYTENNIFLAPLAGYTNAVFRKMCFSLGAGLTFTEMVSSKGLVYNSEKTRELLKVKEGSGLKAVQLFGHEPEFIKKCVNMQEIAPFDIIDINMGCPVLKIVKNGDGSALMENMPLASKVIKSAKTAGKPVTVKFRVGIRADKLCAVEFAKMCEDSGADMITIHGRTRDKMYAGPVDIEQIALAKQAVKIPVIANGGVFTKEDAQSLLTSTGSDGVMIARGAMYNPWVFADILEKAYDKKKDILKQIDDTKALFGERFACVFMRKMAAFYLKGMPNSLEIKKQLYCCPATDDVKKIVEKIQWDI